jgi:chloramphenicol-sensitive protein RarD
MATKVNVSRRGKRIMGDTVNGKMREGLLYGLGAYGLWGVVPLYFCLLRDDIAAHEILAHRIVWSAVFLAAILTFAARWEAIGRCLRTRSLLLPLLLSAVLVGINWLVYIYSVSQQRIAEASLGYYVTPLVSVLIGLVVFRERLRPWQWVAVCVAAAGVTSMTLAMRQWPWIALTLAISFGCYGAIRKTVPVDGLIGLTVETFVLVPACVVYFLIANQAGILAATIDRPGRLGLVALSGIITAVPLLCFGQAARRLPLTVMGFLQYFSPTLQLLIAVFILGERTDTGWGHFALIWTALAIFSVDSLAYAREQRSRALSGIEDERAASHGEGATPPRETARQPSL